MQYTTNYSLNQWEEADRVTRESFNADNLAVDTALGTIAADAARRMRAYRGSLPGIGTLTHLYECPFNARLMVISSMSSFAFIVFTNTSDKWVSYVLENGQFVAHEGTYRQTGSYVELTNDSVASSMSDSSVMYHWCILGN